MTPVSKGLHFQGMSTGKAGRGTSEACSCQFFCSKQLSFAHVLEESTQTPIAENYIQLGTHTQLMATFHLEW